MTAIEAKHNSVDSDTDEAAFYELQVALDLIKSLTLHTSNRRFLSNFPELVSITTLLDLCVF